jgi:hypothetical protein
MKNTLACTFLCLIIGTSVTFAGKPSGGASSSTTSKSKRTQVSLPQWTLPGTSSRASSSQDLSSESGYVPSDGEYEQTRSEDGSRSSLRRITSSPHEVARFNAAQKAAYDAALAILKELGQEHTWIADDHSLISRIINAIAIYQPVTERRNIIEIVIADATALFEAQRSSEYTYAILHFADFSESFREIAYLRDDVRLFIIDRLDENQQATDTLIKQFIAARFLQDNYDRHLTHFSTNGTFLPELLPYIELLVTDLDQDVDAALSDIQAIPGLVDPNNHLSLLYCHYYLLRNTHAAQPPSSSAEVQNLDTPHHQHPTDATDALEHLYTQIIENLSNVILYLNSLNRDFSKIDFTHKSIVTFIRLLKEFSYHFTNSNALLATLQDTGADSPTRLNALIELSNVIAETTIIAGIETNAHELLNSYHNTLLFLHRTIAVLTDSNVATSTAAPFALCNVDYLVGELSATHHLAYIQALTLSAIYTHHDLMAQRNATQGIQRMLTLLTRATVHITNHFQNNAHSPDLPSAIDDLVMLLNEFEAYFPNIQIPEQNQNWIQLLEDSKQKSTGFQIATLFSIVYIIYTQDTIHETSTYNSQDLSGQLAALKPLLVKLFNLFLANATQEFTTAATTGDYQSLVATIEQYMYLRERYETIPGADFTPPNLSIDPETELLPPNLLFLGLLHLHYQYLHIEDTNQRLHTINDFLGLVFIYAEQVRGNITRTHNQARLGTQTQPDAEASNVLDSFCIILNQFAEMFLERPYATADNADITPVENDFTNFHNLLSNLRTSQDPNEQIKILKDIITLILGTIPEIREHFTTSNRLAAPLRTPNPLATAEDHARQLQAVEEVLRLIESNPSLRNFDSNALTFYNRLVFFVRTLLDFQTADSTNINPSIQELAAQLLQPEPTPRKSKKSTPKSPLENIIIVFENALRNNLSPDAEFDTNQPSFTRLLQILNSLSPYFPNVASSLKTLNTQRPLPYFTAIESLITIYNAIGLSYDNASFLELGTRLYTAFANYMTVRQRNTDLALNTLIGAIYRDITILKYSHPSPSTDSLESSPQLFQFGGLLETIARSNPTLQPLARELNTETDITQKLRLLYKILLQIFEVPRPVNVDAISDISTLSNELLALVLQTNRLPQPNPPSMAGDPIPMEECPCIDDESEEGTNSSTPRSTRIHPHTENPYTGDPEEQLHYLRTIDSFSKSK